MIQKSNKQNIIFDFGGVIFEPQYITVNKFFEKYGLCEGRDYIGNQVWKKLTDRFPFRKKVKMQSADFWKEYALELGLSLEVGLELVEFLKKDWSSQIYPETLEALIWAKKNNFGLYYLTNTSIDIFEVRKESQIFGYFDGGVNDLEQPVSKPNPQIYNFLLNKYHLLPENCLFIDDTLENIQTA